MASIQKDPRARAVGASLGEVYPKAISSNKLFYDGNLEDRRQFASPHRQEDIAQPKRPAPSCLNPETEFGVGRGRAPVRRGGNSQRRDHPAESLCGCIGREG